MCIIGGYWLHISMDILTFRNNLKLSVETVYTFPVEFKTFHR